MQTWVAQCLTAAFLKTSCFDFLAWRDLRAMECVQSLKNYRVTKISCMSSGDKSVLMSSQFLNCSSFGQVDLFQVVRNFFMNKWCPRISTSIILTPPPPNGADVIYVPVLVLQLKQTFLETSCPTYVRSFHKWIQTVDCAYPYLQSLTYLCFRL